MPDTDAISRTEFRAAHEAVQSDIRRLDMQINGNGQPGIRQDIADILLHQAEVKGTLAERTIQENKHYKLMTLLVSMLSVFVALGALVVTIYMAKHS